MLTVPYVELNNILVRNKESSYPDEGLVGAVLEGREMPEHISTEKTVYYSNITSGLSDVNKGKVDFFMVFLPRLENVIQQNNFMNLVQVNLVNEIQKTCFAVRSSGRMELFFYLK